MIEVDITIQKVEYETLFDKNFCTNTITNVYNTLLKEKSLNIKKKCDNVLVSVFITDDTKVKELNNAYRGIDATTDVLSFAFEDNITGDTNFPIRNLGEIVISYECTLRNAKEFNENSKIEAARLLVHGFLHLLGFNHSTNDFNKESMLILQEKLLKQSLGEKWKSLHS